VPVSLEKLIDNIPFCYSIISRINLIKAGLSCHNKLCFLPGKKNNLGFKRSNWLSL